MVKMKLVTAIMRSLHGSLNKPGPEEVNHTFIQQTLASFLTCTADLTSVMSALEQMVDQSSGLSFIQSNTASVLVIGMFTML